MSTSFLNLKRRIGESNLIAFLWGMRAGFDLSGSVDALGRRPQSDLDALEEDWEAVGSDFARAHDALTREVDRRDNNQLELAL